jgi:hypothetical protein
LSNDQFQAAAVQVEEARGRQRRRRLWTAAAAALLIWVGVTLAYFRLGGDSGQRAQPPKPNTQPTLPDGRHFGYVRKVHTESSPATIDFDVARFLVGAAAQRAAKEDGILAPGEPVSNDYHIRNQDQRTRALVIAADARVTAALPVTVLSVRPPPPCRIGVRSPGCQRFPVTITDFLASFTAGGRGNQGRYWVTVRGDRVIAIREQYVP